MSPRRGYAWVYDPQRGGTKIPTREYGKIRERIEAHARKLYPNHRARLTALFSLKWLSKCRLFRQGEEPKPAEMQRIFRVLATKHWRKRLRLIGCFNEKSAVISSFVVNFAMLTPTLQAQIAQRIFVAYDTFVRMTGA